MTTFNRRDFLKTTLIGGAATAYFSPAHAISSFLSNVNAPSGVSLTTGNNRADLAFRALKPFSKQIKQAIGNKRVVLKPNNVTINIPLSSTHVDTLEGVLEFLKSIKKLDNVIIAESSASGSTLEGYDNYGYYNLIKKFQVKLVDLDQEKFELMYLFDEKDFRPHPLRMSSVLLDPNAYIVSVARMKTHDRIVATLSLKNVAVGAPIKDLGFAWGKNRKPGTKNDKPIVHGNGFRGLNYNLFTLAGKLHPHLAVIDGFEGMEGNGPNNGTPVDHRICVASPDWLAADRVAVELMGIDFSKIGYLNYCAQAGMGVADLVKIEVIGENLKDHIKSYKLSNNINDQLIWMKA